MADNRTLAQFFFEHGFFDCYAEALARNDAKPFAVPDDRGMELLWKRHPNGIDSKDLADFNSKVALANAAPDMLAALEKYADQLCEGWCEKSPECANFDDCGGCEARRIAWKASL